MRTREINEYTDVHRPCRFLSLQVADLYVLQVRDTRECQSDSAEAVGDSPKISFSCARDVREMDL